MNTTTVRERPILFQPRLVRAILDGRKSVTRRVINPQPDEVQLAGYPALEWKFATWAKADEPKFPTPYGMIGDHLWVRETWARDEGRPGKPAHVIYRADKEYPGKWRPSIFMPRWASRLQLVVTKIQAERLQFITEDQAILEGVVPDAHAQKIAAINGGRFEGRPHVAQFVTGWARMHRSREHYHWDANPWVWVISFRVLA